MNGLPSDPRVFAVCNPYVPDFFSDPYVVIEAGLILLILIGIFSLVALYFCKWYFRKPVALWDRAFEKLATIAQRDVKSKKDIKSSYYDLTDLIKWYVGSRFLIPLISLTDDEAISYLKCHIKDGFLVENIAEIFRTALGIKYARYETLYESLQHDINVMQKIIQHTVPQKKRY
ncbi:hypothetical protein COB28_04310 [Candidatus Dependentiae bacterium]|nr:MAG: hypothetical protein COB28_04310 [Candidatus Dependentiae bacterium]